MRNISDNVVKTMNNLKKLKIKTPMLCVKREKTNKMQQVDVYY
jgi:hypothetical protein